MHAWSLRLSTEDPDELAEIDRKLAARVEELLQQRRGKPIPAISPDLPDGLPPPFEKFPRTGGREFEISPTDVITYDSGSQQNSGGDAMTTPDGTPSEPIAPTRKDSGAGDAAALAAAGEARVIGTDQDVAGSGAADVRQALSAMKGGLSNKQDDSFSFIRED